MTIEELQVARAACTTDQELPQQVEEAIAIGSAVKIKLTLRGV